MNIRNRFASEEFRPRHDLESEYGAAVAAPVFQTPGPDEVVIAFDQRRGGHAA